LNLNQRAEITLVSLYGDTDTGGVERVVFYLKNILAEKFSVVLIKKNGKPRKLDKLFFPFLFSLLLFFKKKSFTISNSWQSFLYPADLSIHHGTTAGFMLASGTHMPGSRILAWMEKISARRAKRVIAVSSGCLKELEELYHIPPEKCVVLNNFVDERLFFPLPDQRPPGGQIPGENAEPPIRILFSGRLEERKGLSKLLRLAQTIEGSKEFRLRIASNSALNAELFSPFKNTVLSSGLDIGGMRSFYNSGDILYFPSMYEGFSMAALEALACGIPVIGSRYAVPEELRGYGFARVFEDDPLPSTLLGAVRELYHHFRDRREEIHSRIAKDFGYTQYKEKLLSLVSQINDHA
jgi:glycosyltransferase involved in cell wall biosynthesis